MSRDSNPLPFLLLTAVLGVGNPLAAQSSNWVEYPITSSSGAMAVEPVDIDGDGDMDIVFGGSTPGQEEVGWSDNVTGLGTTWSDRTILVPATPLQHLDTGDIDGDGDADVLDIETNGVSWEENLVGNGAAWVNHSIDSDILFQGRYVEAVDVDRDGDLDVVIGRLSVTLNSITWYENVNSDGLAWVGHDVLTNVLESTFVQTADVDLDGDLDFIGGSAVNAEVSWHENTNGAATSWTSHQISNVTGAVPGIRAQDVDCDGDVDVAYLSATLNLLGWLENTSAGSSWQSHGVATVSVPTDVELLDLDEDGDLDLLVAADGSNGVLWYENVASDGSDWTETLIRSSTDGPVTLSSVDLDIDGNLDILCASSGSSDIGWLENPIPRPAKPDWTPTIIATSTGGVDSVFAIDIDGDGDRDAVAGSFGDMVAWYENLSGDGTTWQELVISTSADTPEAVFAADVDGDGDVDVLSASSGDDKIAWYNNLVGDGSIWSEVVISASADGANSIFSADVDSDGDFDVVSTARNIGEVAWYNNVSGDGSTWVKTIVDITNVSTESVFAVDLDGDGDTDILTASRSGNTVVWYENLFTSGIVWVENVVSIGANNAESVFPADIDGDGDLDALSAGFRISWHINLAGDGSAWADSVITGTTSESVFGADLDADGDADVVSAGTLDSAWYENVLGSGFLWNEHFISTQASEPKSVFAADLNGDSIVDVLSGTALPGQLRWHGFVPLGSLAFGCGVNPPRSLRIVSPPWNPLSIVFGIDNPLETQPHGSLAFLVLSFAPDSNYPCGKSIASFGMAGSGAPGEILLSIAPGDVILPAKIGPPWTGFGCPSLVPVSIPLSASLLGIPLYAQGLILDPSNAFGTKFGVTNAVEFEIDR